MRPADLQCWESLPPGQYLGPEPLLQSPSDAVSVAAEASSSPAYSYAGNNPIAFFDSTGLATYMCTKPLERFGPLGGNGRRSGPDIPGNPLYHQYLCVTRPGQPPRCNGQMARGGYFGPGAPTDSMGDSFSPDRCTLINKDNWCMDYCVMNGMAEPRPYYSLIPVLPHKGGRNCQGWADDLKKRCVDACKDVLDQGAFPP
jgi:hypothetical protein